MVFNEISVIMKQRTPWGFGTHYHQEKGRHHNERKKHLATHLTGSSRRSGHGLEHSDLCPGRRHDSRRVQRAEPIDSKYLFHLLTCRPPLLPDQSNPQRHPGYCELQVYREKIYPVFLLDDCAEQCAHRPAAGL